MEKTYKTIKMLTVLFVLMAAQAAAQLNGNYTINSGLATGSGNYQTFTDFANDINTNGVSGPVSVTVVTGSGPYNEQVTFNTISGASATNQITIHGNGNTLTFGATSSSAPWTLGLNGTDYMTVNNLDILGTGTTYAMVAHLWGGADHNTFNGCRFTCNANQQSSYQVPFSISSSNSSPTTMGSHSGNYNTVSTSTLSNGYYGYVSVGPTSGAYTNHNSLLNSLVTDFYYYGQYVYYNHHFTMKGCTMDRMTRTSSPSTMYVAWIYFCNFSIVDGNKWHKIFEAQQGATNNVYWYVAYQNQPGNGRQIFRNNIITDIKHNGSIYMYMMYGGWDIYHNTFDWDYTGGNHTGTLYGLYAYTNSSYGDINIKNNIITMRKPGSGSRYGIYVAITGNMNIDYNDIVPGTGTGGNYIGSMNGSHTTLSSWQSQGNDVNGWSVDPAYTSATDLHPTNTTINNAGTPLGVYLDQMNMPRSGQDPDIGALEFLSVPCTGTPNPGSVLTPTYLLCPGESADMILSNFSSDLGITYQWSSASFSVGPWAPISGANTVLYTAPNVSATTWFQASVTCGNSGLGVTPVGVVNVSGVTTNTAPYYEDFEGIPKQDKLPNCSWLATDLGSGANTYIGSNTYGRVPRSGFKFAAFSYLPAGQKSFYTNGIYMYAGITYSASVWYTTEYYGYNNWTDLSLLVGPNQTAVGQQTITSTNGPAISNIYKSLSGTFQVPTDGYYYAQVRATSVSGSAQYLSWDDLRIEIPCSINSPTINVTTNQATVCANQPVTIQASGADSYTWSTTDQGDIITVVPQFAGMQYYTVIGTSSLSGCNVAATQPVMVNPAPILSTFAVPPVACEGSVVDLYATGATNYIWTTNATGPVASVTPVITGTYAVVGTNQFNCQSTAVINVMVNPKPIIGATHPSEACVGDAVTINASGGVTYSIISQNSFNLVNPAVVMPVASTQYTVYGTDVNGCSSSTMVTIIVNDCVGISENQAMESLRVYPNPTSGEFTIELKNSAVKNVEIADVTGRIVVAQTSAEQQLGLNIGALANGVYYVKVRSQDVMQVIRIIKE